MTHTYEAMEKQLRSMQFALDSTRSAFAALAVEFAQTENKQSGFIIIDVVSGYGIHLKIEEGNKRKPITSCPAYHINAAREICEEETFCVFVREDVVKELLETEIWDFLIELLLEARQ